MTLPPATRGAAPASAVDLLGKVLRTLAFGGPRAVIDATAAVLQGCPVLTSLTVRSAAGGEVLASARRAEPSYDVAPPARRPLDDAWVLDVPLRRGGVAVGVLTAVSDAPFTPQLAGLLSDVAGALALATSAPVEVAARALLDAEADLAAFAAHLGETVGEALVALRHTLPADRDAALRETLRALREVQRELRATSLDGGLRAALLRLREPGVVGVDAADPLLDAVDPAPAVLVERVAVLTCRNAVGPVQITADIDGRTVKLRVLSADNAVDASELARWRRRAGALHGELRHWPGGVELILPTHP